MNKIAADRLSSIEIRILKEVTRITNANSLDCVVVGATARDILLTLQYDVPVQRATADIDFAVAVQNWDEFDLLKKQLSQVPQFYASAKHAYRMHARYDEAPDGIGYPFDFVPYGGVEDPHGRIHWPPDMAVMMQVSAYSEVLAAAVDVQVVEGLTVKVASLPGLTVLKILAWKERGADNAKDALDLKYIMENYTDADNRNRIYDQHYEMLESLEYDLQLAGVRLLAHDARGLVSNQTVARMLELFQDPKIKDKLILAMSGANRNPDVLEKMEGMVGQFIVGLRE
jgi:predicted nucleotidyltransferase